MMAPIVVDMAALSDRLAESLKYANDAHREHTRKGTDIPYVSHLLAVASIVLDHGGDEDEAVAALLHDVPEDCGGRPKLDQIRERFGERVAAIVEGCSDSLVTDPLAKEPWRIRKERYHDHVRQTANNSVLLVSAADKLHNAGATAADLRRDGPSVWSRFKGGRDDAIWNYTVLLGLYSKSTDARVRAIASELEPVVRVLAQFSTHP
jgi:(p)ppGpp synthase/HD superfamily hydrolase